MKVVEIKFMGEGKKEIRNRFRSAVFKRDKYRCRGTACKFFSSPEKANVELDSHHIIDRNEMISGGYVPENGITLCKECHKKAEKFHETGIAHPGFSPDELYEIIGSSRDKAIKASKNL